MQSSNPRHTAYSSTAPRLLPWLPTGQAGCREQSPKNSFICIFAQPETGTETCTVLIGSNKLIIILAKLLSSAVQCPQFRSGMCRAQISCRIMGSYSRNNVFCRYNFPYHEAGTKLSLNKVHTKIFMVSVESALSLYSLFDRTMSSKTNKKYELYAWINQKGKQLAKSCLHLGGNKWFFPAVYFPRFCDIQLYFKWLKLWGYWETSTVLLDLMVRMWYSVGITKIKCTDVGIQNRWKEVHLVRPSPCQANQSFWFWGMIL